MTVSLSRTRRNLGALTALTVGATLTDAPLWTVLVLTLTSLAIPAAVGLHGGPPLVRALLLGSATSRPRGATSRPRPVQTRRRKEELV